MPYDGDMDDRVLEEMRPRFVVMYEPNPSFIRRVEVPPHPSTYAGLPSIPPVTIPESLFLVLCKLGRRTTLSLSRPQGERCIHEINQREREYGACHTK
jgi:hypothetical protein